MLLNIAQRKVENKLSMVAVRLFLTEIKKIALWPAAFVRAVPALC
jgi:hypothetical protein